MVATVMNLINIIIGFVAQRIFIQTLGTEYLGINGLFTNILSMLGIVELGLGSAIIYHLYQPIAEQDKEKINHRERMAIIPKYHLHLSTLFNRYCSFLFVDL